MRYGIAIVLGLGLASALAEAQGAASKSDTSTATAITTAKTPHDCEAAYYAEINKRVAAAEKAHQSLDVPAIVTEPRAKAKQCAAQFDPSKLDAAQLSDLGSLYLSLHQPELATQAFKRVDSMPGAVVPQFRARSTMLSYDDEHDVDSGIARIAPEMIALAHQMTPVQLDSNADRLINAYVTLSEVSANALHTDSALAIVRRADHDFPALANVKGWHRNYLDKAIARYAMVGTKAPSLDADYWRNGTGKSVNTDGPTLVMFSAHDCPACRLSYPTIAKIDSTYAPRGFHLVMSVDLGGDFDNKPMTPEQEVSANLEFYHKLKLTAPIAFQRATATDENGNAVPGPDANSNRYHTSGIPYFFVIDRQGVIRASMVGWDTSGVSEKRLRTLITSLLSPSNQG